MQNCTPLRNAKSTPTALSAQLRGHGRYVSSDKIRELVIEVYKRKRGRGITYQDLLENGLAVHKKQVQDMLKYHLRKGTLFTLVDRLLLLLNPLDEIEDAGILSAVDNAVAFNRASFKSATLADNS